MGEGEGRGFSVNVPLLEGVTDEGYMQLFGPVLNEVRYLFSLIHHTIHILFQNILKIYRVIFLTGPPLNLLSVGR